MPKVYERCPRCGRKGLFRSGPRSWLTTMFGRQVKACRYCSFIDPQTPRGSR